MPNKTVSYPIRVPEGDYCWNANSICGHFDNYGGHPNCTLNMGNLKYNSDMDSSVEKPPKCKNLETL